MALIITEDEKHALAAAVTAFEHFGIDFRAPWECDLDDLERERFEAMVAACRSYHNERLNRS